MKVKIFFVHPKNYGNMMMVNSFLMYSHNMLESVYGDSVKFFVDVLDDEELSIVKKNIPEYIDVEKDVLYNQRRRGILGKIQKLLFLPIEVIHNIRNFDVCIILGGDCISEYYSKQKFLANLVKFHFISQKKTIYALGQTMGPFSKKYHKFVKWALNNCVIYARDEDCYKYLTKDIMLTSVYSARDLALLDIPFQNCDTVVRNTIEKYIGNKSRYITFVPSGANQQYTSDAYHYVDEYTRMIKNSIDMFDCDVLLLAHVIHTETSNDKLIIDKIMEIIPDYYKERIHCVNYLILPYEARILLGNGLFTVTGRMHAAVSSLNMGKIPICLSYSVKYKGVIGDPYDLNDYIIQCRGNEAWVGHTVSDRVLDIEKKVLDNYETLIVRIKERNEYNKKLAYLQIEKTVNGLSNL